jgi:predicted Zn-dependent peptidase
MYKDMPNRHVHHVFSELLYGDQPAGRNIAGNEETVKSFNRQNFLDYIKDHYVAESTTIVLSGTFDEIEIIEKVKERFKNIPISNKRNKEKVIENQNKPEISILFKDTDQAHMVIGFRSVGARDKEEVKINVLATILGRGMSSRLFQKLREEMGVGYYIYASQDSYTDHGVFSISTGVDTKRIEEVIKTILNECKNFIENEITEKELQKAKDYMSGSFVLGLETSDSFAEYIAINSIVKGKIERPEEEISDIQKVTIQDIKDIAKKLFQDEIANLAIIGPYKDKKIFENIFTFKN